MLKIFLILYNHVNLSKKFFLRTSKKHLEKQTRKSSYLTVNDIYFTM